jgi:hypothetical protein
VLLSKLRVWCFWVSLVTIALALPAALLALAHPFPLIEDGNGGYSNSRNFQAVTAALCASALAFLFSIFANRWRGRLVLSSIVLILLSYLSLFTDGH